MQLHYTVSGEGEPLVILHGLFGTLENWGAQTRALAAHFRVYALDLRNHGRSPWSDEMDYPAMAGDVLAFLDAHGLNQVLLLGHSMGGKAAMQLALDHPERIRKLVVVDIAPVSYPAGGHSDVFEGLFAVPLDKLQSRGEADAHLKSRIPDAGVRQFLLKNLYRHNGHFAWRMNLATLHREYDRIIAAPESRGRYPGPTLFIKGGNSDYIQEQHREAIGRRFPGATARVIPGAGHWPHAEKPELFTKLVQRFLEQPEGA